MIRRLLAPLLSGLVAAPLVSLTSSPLELEQSFSNSPQNEILSRAGLVVIGRDGHKVIGR